MRPAGGHRPELSYVLAALTSDEVHAALGWLRSHPLADGIELILAAPASALSQVAAAAVPRTVGLVASSGAGRAEVRVAGARATTGQVVVAIDCDNDLTAELGDRLGHDPRDNLDNLDSIDADLPPVVGHIGTLPPVAPGVMAR